MSNSATPTFDAIAKSLGDFTCQNAPAVVHLRNPFALSNWTLPVLELMMVAGAVLALLWAIRRLRRDGDPTNLALWFATVIYLFVIEIPLYFPNIFGVEDSLGVVFAHNAFTVQFLFERLPLYIVALYPAVITLAYEIVRVAWGVPRSRHDRRCRLCRVCPPLLLRGVRSTRTPITLVGMEHRQPAEPSVPGVGADDQRLHLRDTRAGRGHHAGDVLCRPGRRRDAVSGAGVSCGVRRPPGC